MTEAELLTITTARKRQVNSTTKPLQIRPSRRASQRRKKSSSIDIAREPYISPKKVVNTTQSPSKGYINRIQLSDVPSKTSSSPSSRSKQKLPALTHLDDKRQSLDISQPNTLGTRPSRASSLHPSPISSAPPSSFSSPEKNASSKRLSDQLRGFASINLDGVGSWADDVLGLVSDRVNDGTVSSVQAKGSEIQKSSPRSPFDDPPKQLGISPKAHQFTAWAPKREPGSTSDHCESKIPLSPVNSVSTSTTHRVNNSSYPTIQLRCE